MVVSQDSITPIYVARQVDSSEISDIVEPSSTSSPDWCTAASPEPTWPGSSSPGSTC